MAYGLGRVLLLVFALYNVGLLEWLEKYFGTPHFNSLKYSMKKTFKVIHSENARDAFPLDNEQIRREYNLFPRMVSKLFANPNIKANGENLGNSVNLTLEGNVTEAEVISAAEQFLILLNAIKVEGRVGQTNFVFASNN